MPAPLGLKNLMHNGRRTLVATAGVTFAVALMFLQLGFLQTAETTATTVYKPLKFDVCLISKDYHFAADARSVPRFRLYEAASVPGVQEAQPLNVGINQWRNPHNGEASPVMVLGVDPTSEIFASLASAEEFALLTAPHYILIDSQTRPELGPAAGDRFGPADAGREIELGIRTVRIRGTFVLGAGFAAAGAVLTSDSGFGYLFPGHSDDSMSVGLLRLEPDADAPRVARQINALLDDEDVLVLTKEQILERESDRWVEQTSYGIIFRLGCFIAFLVGTGIVYQILSSDVANHRAEYATLRAIGYRNSYINLVVLQQAIALAVLGTIPGIGVAFLLYTLTARQARIPISLTTTNVLVVVGLTLAMCLVSGLIALRKVRQADPADLF
ncbi:MAG: hypothetical protein DWQ34_14590 [Planctomycetota bacterium]|nr:MAG: hypothetical protein DWQ29_13680 [Planctomycetota bacterium]REJ91664.1 MAG: hypothetical protein DWQ34_14590 [Planctomycetota bacterium]REK19968.1 MAG: hypothetical protein DWQ41_26965 [Planctomycetota bacterium]REK27535.1 MAG: hypothetical protein DWQ45_25985 [Planctomycetota bacterium]